MAQRPYFDLYSNGIGVKWGAVPLPLLRRSAGAAYRRAYTRTVLDIWVFLTGSGDIAAATYLKLNAAPLQTEPLPPLHCIEQLFTRRDSENPLPDAYDRHPEMRYMVANLRCATPLTEDVLRALQPVANQWDSLGQAYLPDHLDHAADNGGHQRYYYYAASSSPLDIATAAAGAGLGKKLVELLADIDALVGTERLPHRFYSVLADMRREARDALQRAQRGDALYLCRHTINNK